jgi:nucleotide-binding universal stress UspA family protein
MTAGRIVVGIDGSAASREALRWAVRWAEALGGEVVAVHAVGLLEHRQGLGSDAARRTLVESTWAAPLARTTCAHRVELKDGAALDVLLATAAAERADLLVVGSRGTGDDPDRALGSTSLHVLQEAGLPVLVVPAAGPVAAAYAPVLRRILVGVDRSAPALAALGLAADVAAALGGSLTVLEAIEYVPPFPLGAATTGTGAAEKAPGPGSSPPSPGSAGGDSPCRSWSGRATPPPRCSRSPTTSTPTSSSSGRGAGVGPGS